jgi:hypothetical protein
MRARSNQDTLCTVGDAIASFLENPDPPYSPSIEKSTLLLTQNERLRALRTSAPWLKGKRKSAYDRPARWYETVSRRCLAGTGFL